MQRRILILGMLLIVAVVSALIAVGRYRELARTPGEPKLWILGAPRTAEWSIVPISELRAKTQAGWTLDRLSAGREKRTVVTWVNGERRETVVAGPDRTQETRSVKQSLLRLEVPDRLGSRHHLNTEIVADGDISSDASQYSISFLEASGVSDGHRLHFVTTFDQNERLLSIKLAWAFPGQDGKGCTLRFRLTPAGFATHVD